MKKKEKAASLHIRRTAGDWIFDTAVVVFFCVFTFICVFPFYYLLINTISDNDLVTSGRVNFFPLVKDAAGQAVFGAHFIPRCGMYRTWEAACLLRLRGPSSVQR